MSTGTVNQSGSLIVVNGDGTASVELRRRSQESMWAVIDEGDVELVAGRFWYAHKGTTTHYALHAAGPAGSRNRLRMHRLITGAPSGREVDHSDGDGLNNRRSNLRVATVQENRRNQVRRRGGMSQYKGVSWSGSGQCWMARINTGETYLHLGLYEDEVHAAVAYDMAALVFHLAYANTNFDQEFRDSIGPPARRNKRNIVSPRHPRLAALRESVLS